LRELTTSARRGPVEAQRAAPRGGGDEITFDAEPLFDADGGFAGFRATLHDGEHGVRAGDSAAFEESLDLALRSPLARIISAADHIVERGDGPLRSDYATYASDIAAAARHLLSVIRAMGKGGAREESSIELGALGAEAVGLVDPVASERRITIALDQPAAPMRATGEARAVVQILVNIIGNAVRHSPDGGRVAVGFAADTHEYRIAVRDEGPGIAPADQKRIFERYERVGTAPDGSGLGLAIARRLARSMGGDIRLDSTPGEGACFTLVLPAA
jgi:signal transduction histidine kinase